MSKHYLYHKDELILEITDNYNCVIHNYNLLPIGLRYKDVNYDDIMHGWLESRNMSLGRTHAKELLATCGISQRNSYAISKLFHFASLTDCYWLKDEGESILWEDVNLFKNKPEQLLINTALFGKKPVLPITKKIHTPEFATQGNTAKAWIYNEKEIPHLWLYKVAKKELIANDILNQLNINHIPYYKVPIEELYNITDEERIQKIKNANECVVKCPCITNEDISIVTWEDFCIYCERNNLDCYKELELLDKSGQYYDMLIADYILGNDDRHEANWGFFMDNNTGNLLSLHPLMDHDHAFKTEELFSQTTDILYMQKDAVLLALNNKNNLNLSIKRPDLINDEEWNAVQNRLNYLKTKVKEEYINDLEFND